MTTGSAPWLLRHELRLAWRGAGGKRVWIIAAGGGLLWALLHLLVYGLMSTSQAARLPPSTFVLFGGLTWLVITLMLSQGILLSVAALFDRGDLDLLLASPLAPRTVFLVRGLGIAVSCVALYLIVLTPFANVGLLAARPALLAIYPALLSLALLATALGMLLTLALVRALGARRARTVAQLIGAFAGASLFLLSQGSNLLGADTRRHLVLTLLRWTAEGGPLAADSAWWLPLRALLGEPLPLAAVMGAGIGAFWLVVGLTHRRFLAGTQESVSGSARRGGIAPAQGRTRFRAGLWRNVLVKEWRLIARDPQLITQSLMQMLYLLPLVFVVFRRQDMLSLVVPGAVMLASTLAGSLAWITVAAEDAPELIGAAPVPLARVRRIKACAALLPAWLLVLPLMGFLLVHELLAALVFVVCLAGGTLSLVMTQLWYPRQANRRDMRRRAQNAKLIGLLENLSAMGWAGAAFCLLHLPLYAPLALLVGSIGPLAAWFMGRSRRAESA